MPTIQVEPSGVAFDVVPGETIMGAATRHGIRWPTICGGQAECTVCAVVVLDGADRLGPVAPPEAGLLPRVPEAMAQPGATVRLACQARVDGDVVVMKRGVRPRPHEGAHSHEQCRTAYER